MVSLYNGFPDICCKGGIYKNKDFDNLCSKCFKVKNPEKWYEKIGQFMIKNPEYSSNYLEELVRTRSLPNKDPCFQMLKFMCKNGSINEKNNYLNIINVIKDTSDFKGWTANQASKLTSIFINKHCNGEWEEMKPGKKYWRLQHMICGGVVDWWNLDPNKVGGIGYCYYAHFGEKPRMYCKDNIKKQYRIPLPPAFRDDNYGSREEKVHYKMWLESVFIK